MFLLRSSQSKGFQRGPTEGRQQQSTIVLHNVFVCILSLFVTCKIKILCSLPVAMDQYNNGVFRYAFVMQLPPVPRLVSSPRLRHRINRTWRPSWSQRWTFGRVRCATGATWPWPTMFVGRTQRAWLWNTWSNKRWVWQKKPENARKW